MLSVFLKSMLIGYSGAIIPGALFTYTVDKSMKHGVKAGVLAAFGHCLLELIIIILICFGAGRFLAGNIAKTVIGIVGGLVLGYLGITMLRDVYLNKISLNSGDGDTTREGNLFMAGIVLSITNPYFIIWWTAVGLALIMSAYHSFGVLGIAIFYLGHIIADISWFAFISALVDKARNVLNTKVYRVITVLLAVCLLGFGTSFFVSSVRYFF